MLLIPRTRVRLFQKSGVQKSQRFAYTSRFTQTDPGFTLYSVLYSFVVDGSPIGEDSGMDSGSLNGKENVAPENQAQAPADSASGGNRSAGGSCRAGGGAGAAGGGAGGGGTLGTEPGPDAAILSFFKTRDAPSISSVLDLRVALSDMTEAIEAIIASHGNGAYAVTAAELLKEEVEEDEEEDGKGKGCPDEILKKYQTAEYSFNGLFNIVECKKLTHSLSSSLGMIRTAGNALNPDLILKEDDHYLLSKFFQRQRNEKAVK